MKENNGNKKSFSREILIGADLSNLDLTYADLNGANLSGANLSNLDLTYADLNGANLSGANLSGANLSGANLSGTYADLNGANLSGANLSNLDLTYADLNGANLNGANLNGANLSGADLSGANLSGANLSGANLSYANLAYTNLSSANLSGANLNYANLTFNTNLSHVRGLVDAIHFMQNRFEKTNRGYLVYKVFNDCYDVPDYWDIREGTILREICNPERTNPCGCGINVGTLDYVKSAYPGKQIYKLLIRYEWLAGVVVPYNTDGNIRCSCAQIIEKINLVL